MSRQNPASALPIRNEALHAGTGLHTFLAKEELEKIRKFDGFWQTAQKSPERTQALKIRDLAFLIRHAQGTQPVGCLPWRPLRVW